MFFILGKLMLIELSICEKFMTRLAKRYVLFFLTAKIGFLLLVFKLPDQRKICDKIVIEEFESLSGDTIFEFRRNSTLFLETNFVEVNRVERGCFKPESCESSESVNILIPYRNRLQELNELLPFLHRFLINQKRNYCIYVIEQNDSKKFNRGALLNAGFKLSRKSDCYITHDVDLIPIDPRNLYSCYQKAAVRMSSRIDTINFTDPMKAEDNFFISAGGVVSFTKKQFLFANGFSNDFWGWGPEDQDMARRVRDYFWDNRTHNEKGQILSNQ